MQSGLALVCVDSVSEPRPRNVLFIVQLASAVPLNLADVQVCFINNLSLPPTFHLISYDLSCLCDLRQLLSLDVYSIYCSIIHRL